MRAFDPVVRVPVEEAKAEVKQFGNPLLIDDEEEEEDGKEDGDGAAGAS